MIVAPFKVVLDANVLFPFTLRDVLLRAAADGMFQLYWSSEILDEVERNLLRKSKMTAPQATRLRSLMTTHFPESMVAGYEQLVPAMTNDAKDRHVVAAAVKAGAQVIVTFNLKDFQSLPDDLEAQSPDEFLCDLYDLDPRGILKLLSDAAQALKRPPRSLQEMIAGLSGSVPEFAKCVSVDH